MRPFLFSCLFLVFSLPACAQQGNKANRLGRCQDPGFDQEVASWLKFTVPAIDVDSLRRLPADSVLVLDAREPAEYNVSHIEGSANCGYDRFDIATLDKVDKNRRVVVYCSIGYRSEKIAEKLRDAGFTRVYNLYGSIFEWANRNYPLVDEYDRPTVRLHTYNRDWGRWVKAEGREKVTRYVPAPKPSAAEATVHYSGAMRRTMREGQLAATILLDTLRPGRHLYGLGPLEYLRGEIMMLDGVVYQSRIDSAGNIVVEKTGHAGAPFFVYSRVYDWSAQRLPDSIQTLAQLETYLQQSTQERQRPFAFLLKGPVASAKAHIQNLPEGTPVHSPEDARTGQVSFTVEREACQILGFFSTEHQGVFTHHGSFLHLHLMSADGKKMGHVDALQLTPGGMVLYLPR